MSHDRQLHGSVVPVGAVSLGLAQEMFDVFDQHYDGVTWGQFQEDLYEKELVLLLRDRGRGTVRGFSTLMTLWVTVDETRVPVAFSGDTIIDRAFWGEQELVKIWYQAMERIRQQVLPSTLYWLLISKGYRTYLYLPAFFKEYAPSPAGCPSVPLQQLMDGFGYLKYPRHYNPATGVIEFPKPMGRLKDHLATVPSHRMKDPYVRFFFERNPGYTRGTELVCIAEFSPRNFRPFGMRLVGATVDRDG